MQKGRIINEIVGIVHAATCRKLDSGGRQTPDIFLCKFVEHARIVTVVV
jgi:hypothetical protein